MKSKIIVILALIFFIYFLKTQPTSAAADCAVTNPCRGMLNIVNLDTRPLGKPFNCGQYNGCQDTETKECMMDKIPDNYCVTSTTVSPTSTAIVSSGSAYLKINQQNKVSNVILYSIIASVYMAVVYFAIGIKGGLSFFLFIGCFVIGGIFSYLFSAFETGLIFSIILSLIFW